MNLDIESLAREMTGEIGEALFIELSNASWDQLKCSEIKELGISFGSHQGLVRNRHEDRSAVARISAANGQRYLVAVVCDGVGGSKNGDLAASIAVATLFSELARIKTAISGEQILSHVIRRMDDKVRACLSGSGSTTASIILATSAGELIGGSIGDSRIYTWDSSKDKRLTQISEDDTLGNEAKKLNMQDVSALAQKGLLGSLSQAIGEAGRESRELNIVLNKSGDFLRSVAICSDGCWKHDPIGFELVVANAKSSIESSRRALALANWTGGSDNSSIIIIEDTSRLIALCSHNAPKSHESTKVEVWLTDQKFTFFTNYIFSSTQAESQLSAPEKKPVKRPGRSKQKNEIAPPEQLNLVERTEIKKRQRISSRPKIEISVDTSIDSEENYKQ